MAYLPAGMPLPQPGAEDLPFWQGCRERRLMISYCADCRRFYHPPMPSCPRCASMNVGWREVSGNGTVFTYTVSHSATHPSLKGFGPYNIVVVLLDDADDVRLVSNLVDVAPDELEIGMPVSVFWDVIDEHNVLPRFKRKAPDGAGGPSVGDGSAA